MDTDAVVSGEMRIEWMEWVSVDVRQLVTDLLDQIAEDERVARAALTDSTHCTLGPVGVDGAPEWVAMEERRRWVSGNAGPIPTTHEAVIDTGSRTSIRVSSGGDPPARNVSDHIARWDPARVLAECEAKRQIIQICVDGQNAGEHWDHDCILYLLAASGR